MEDKKTNICCICGKEIKGWPNDAWPVGEGYCCGECNAEKVLPARLRMLIK